MVEVAETAESGSLVSLQSCLDDLTTRLLVEGIGSLNPEEFDRIAQQTRQDSRVAGVAVRLANALREAGKSSAPEPTTQILTAGIEELRISIGAAERGAVHDSQPARTKEAAVEHTVPEIAPNILAADEEMIREFITESGEHLSNIEEHVLALEKDNKAVETLNAVFRAFHTIKGLAGFLDFPSIQSLAHEVETLLDLARTFRLEVTPSVVDVVLESTDVVRQELARIELRLAGKPGPPSHVTGTLLTSIRDIASGRLPEATQIVEAAVGKPSRSESEAPTSRAATESPRPADSASVRIDTGKLDLLMDMVGEMVIAQTLIGHSPALIAAKDPRLLRDLTQLARITSDVQRITTGMRMVPIGIQFQKTARLVRDLSRKAGKQIVLETSGEETELDKTIAEELSDPLLHMVRNSIDHGIETTPERLAVGKDPTARVRLAAYHQSGQIVVEVGDDGRGLNRDKILAKAQQNGLIAPGAQLTDQEIFHLIFEAGFSTADKITDISGRGVGMDVVRKHVQKLRGRIDIHSQPGAGTNFLIKLPLTLAIIEGLVVNVGNERYIVPIFSVREMFRPTSEMLSTVKGSAEMVLVRGSLLPIVRLHQHFRNKPRTASFTEGVLIVAEAEGKQFCLFVDDLVGKQEVVIKSLGESFKHVQGIAGCAILGDGRVGLILDIDGIYKGRN